MSDEEKKPYNYTRTTTMEISPIRVTIVNDTKSSEAPKPCPCSEVPTPSPILEALHHGINTILTAIQNMRSGPSSAIPGADLPSDPPTDF